MTHNLRRIRAVFGMALLSGIRQKWLILSYGTLLILVFAVPFFLKTDGTLSGLVQTVISYSLTVGYILTSMMALWFGSGAISQEITDKTIYMSLVKPVSRGEYWLGKYAALAAVCIFFTSSIGLMTYGVIILRTNSTVQTESDTSLLKEEVLTARVPVRPFLPDIEDEVTRRYAERRKDTFSTINSMDEETAKDIIRKDIRAGWQSVPPDQTRQWLFTGIPINPAIEKVTLRYSFISSQGGYYSKCSGTWTFGSPRTGRWMSVDVEPTPHTTHTVTLPAYLIDDTGSLYAAFTNRASQYGTTVFDMKNGLTILYPTGSFAANLAAGLTIVALRVLIFAALGLCLSGIVSFPVAAFTSTSFLVIVSFSSTIKDVLKGGSIFVDHHGKVGAPGFVEQIYQGLLKTIMTLTGVWHAYDPFPDISIGIKVNYSLLLSNYFAGIIWLILLIALGMLFFTRRELIVRNEE